MLLTAHYLEEAETADKIRVLNKGRIAAFGTPDQLKAQLLEHYVLLDAGRSSRGSKPSWRTLERSVHRRRAGGECRCSRTTSTRCWRSIETPLNLVKTVTPTLEDAYLSIVGRADDEERCLS